MNKQLFLKLFLVAASINGALYAMEDWQQIDTKYFPDASQKEYFALVNKTSESMFAHLRRETDKENYFFIPEGEEYPSKSYPEESNTEQKSFKLKNNIVYVLKGDSDGLCTKKHPLRLSIRTKDESLFDDKTICEIDLDSLKVFSFIEERDRYLTYIFNKIKSKKINNRNLKQIFPNSTIIFLNKYKD